jgi:hypothetical protein
VRRDFLLETIGPLEGDDKLGFVQTRWLNPSKSFLTWYVFPTAGSSLYSLMTTVINTNSGMQQPQGAEGEPGLPL